MSSGYIKNNFFKILGILLTIGIMTAVSILLKADDGSDKEITQEAIEVADTLGKVMDFEKEVIDVESLNIGAENIYEIRGTSSYYADQFHNRMTANGEIFDMNEFSAAHKTLPFGTILRVTNVKNKVSTLVRVNDRGPYVGDRILDLSYKAARAIGGIKIGTPKVELQGFIPSKNFAPQNDEDYYFAYSLNKQPMCLPQDIFVKIDSTNIFHEAVTELTELSKQADNDYYLVMNTDKDNKYESSKSEFTYYIAKVDKFKNLGIIASK